MLADFAIALAVFAVTTAVAAALGAANFGTALGIGQIAFVFAVTALIVLRRGLREAPRQSPGRPG